MTGRIQKRDALAVRLNLVRADMLGNTAGFARRNRRFANGIEKRGFAVVNVAHDGHDRRARNHALTARAYPGGSALGRANAVGRSRHRFGCGRASGRRCPRSGLVGGGRSAVCCRRHVRFRAGYGSRNRRKAYLFIQFLRDALHGIGGKPLIQARQNAVANQNFLDFSGPDR